MDDNGQMRISDCAMDDLVRDTEELQSECELEEMIHIAGWAYELDAPML